MTTLDLKLIPTPKLAALGDAAFRSGEWGLAAVFYRAILEISPNAPHIQARLGLTANPGSRSQGMLTALEAVEVFKPSCAFVGDGLATWLKTLPFLEDARFMELAARHADLLPVANWHWNLQTALWAVRQVRNLDGDLVELGVFKGHTTLFVAEYVGFEGWNKQWWLYDTFEGIPEDQLDEGWAKNNAKAYSAKQFSFEEVRDRFAHIPNIKVIQGRVPEILGASTPDRIAFIHMDLNNATAEVAALEALFDRIVPGGIILFDDFVWLASHAQFLAETAWFERRGLVVLPIPTGQGLFVKQ